MQLLLLFTLVGFMTSSCSVFALNILGISTLASSSHHIWFAELMKGLALNGHRIYALAMEPTDIQGNGLTQNQTQSFVFEGVMDNYHKEEFFDPVEWSRFSTMGTAWFIHGSSSEICGVQIATRGAKEALELMKNTKIDVIVQDLTSSQCFYGLWEVAQGNPAIVGFTPFGSPNWDLMRRYYYMPMQQQIAERFVGKKISTSIHEVEKKISVVLTNSYAALDPGTFLPPNAIEVGGLHIRDPKPLPEDIKEFLDGAEHGAIVISLGSQIQFKTLALEKLEAIVEALRLLKQRVLWKFETDDLKNKPKNVMIKKWLPQSDVLAHPNVRVLWTHAGLLSIQEAIWRGIPVIGMPFFIDQPANIDLLVKKGVGLQLDFETLTTTTVSQVRHKILNDRSFALRMEQLSREYKDRPMSPLDLAVWHVEYASRHARGPLASPARDMSFVQLNLLDVYAVLGAAIVSISWIFWLLFRSFLILLRPQEKTKTA